jgi:glycosyltransferase involved in cell wall biosynthesis
MMQVQKKYSLPAKYILHVGTLQPRKNIVRLIQAFENLPSKYRLWHLVLVGQTGWLADEIEKAIKLSKKSSQIIQTGFISDNDIPAIFSGAGCLCTVGLYEGFGMPPAEALACGTIPIVSNNTSLPEVVGDAGIRIDPYSIASIVHGIIAALDLTPEQRKKRIDLGSKHIQKFNWTTSAREILRVLYDITIQR